MARAGDPYHGSLLLRLGHVVVLVFYSVSALVLALLAFHNIRGSSTDAADIVQNWKSGAIMDLAVGEGCPEGYESAFNYTWPGTHAGCDCTAVDFRVKAKYGVSTDNIGQGACSSSQLEAGCVDIKGTPEAYLDSWGVKDGHPISLCVRRSSQNWVDVAQNSGEQCKDLNAIRCGKSPNTYFCTNETKCPITEATIVDLANIADAAGCLYDSGCVLLSKDGLSTKAIKFRRGDTADALPLAQFQVNEYGMCKTIHEENITPDRKEFPLLREKRNTCANEGAGLWNTADTITEAKFFDLNGLTSNLTYLNDFGYYQGGKTGKDYHWSLFNRNYLPWAPQCRKDMAKVTAKANGAKGLWIAQLVQVIAGAVATAVLGIILPLMICLDVRETGRKVVNWVGKLLHLPFIVVALLISYFIAKSFRGFVENDCSNNHVLEVLSEAGTDAQVAYRNNLKALGAILLAILFDFLMLLYKGRTNEAYHPQVNIEQTTTKKTVVTNTRPANDVRVDVNAKVVKY